MGEERKKESGQYKSSIYQLKKERKKSGQNQKKEKRKRGAWY